MCARIPASTLRTLVLCPLEVDYEWYRRDQTGLQAPFLSVFVAWRGRKTADLYDPGSLDPDQCRVGLPGPCVYQHSLYEQGESPRKRCLLCSRALNRLLACSH